MLFFFLLLLSLPLCSLSLLPVEEVNKLERSVGDAALENHSPAIFSSYTSMTYKVYHESFLKGDREGWKEKGFVCLNPHAKTYGGMGNLFVGIVGMQFFGAYIGRVPIANNAIFTDLFSHPDARQSFSPLTNDLINKLKARIKGYAAKYLSMGPQFFRNAKFVGSHGAPTIAHGFKAFSPFVPKLLPPTVKLNDSNSKFYNNLMCQGFASWIMSRPSVRSQTALKKYKDNFINRCDEKNIPDIAIQVRTVDSIKTDFNSTLEDCYVSCAVAKARAVYAELGRDICIFVTSNRVNTTDNVVDALNNILNTDDSNPYKFLYHQAVAANASKSIMHSGKFVEAGRHTQTFPFIDYSTKEDVMDWLLLGEAVHVIGSLGSTFLSTARLRIGSPERHIFHPLQHDVSPMLSAKTNFKCHCELHDKTCA